MNRSEALKIPKIKICISSQCPHCPAMLQTLMQLIKNGDIAEMEVSNITLLPEKAQQLQIRAVPWIRIGPFEFTGTQTKKELMHWIRLAQSETGMQAYFTQLLTTGELNKVISLLKKAPELFKHLPLMIQNKETPLGAKIGIAAIFEEFQGSPLIQVLIPALTELLKSEPANTRNDVCYYLGLTESRKAIPTLQSMSNDEVREVRESADDALSIIDQALPCL